MRPTSPPDVAGHGKLVVFEGIDGCGKSTQVRRVAAARGALATFEPGDTALGVALRTIVLDHTIELTPLVEVLVVAADRAQHVADVINPALVGGRDVVCDRYSGSTIAYQGFGRGVPVDSINHVLEVATGGRAADLTILLDCPVDVASTRRAGRPAPEDRFESADAGFLERVREGFLELAGRSSASWQVVDADVPLDRLNAQIDAVLAAVLGW